MNALHEVPRAIYAAVVRSGRPPTPSELAPDLSLDEGAVADAYRSLAEAHLSEHSDLPAEAHAIFASVGLTGPFWRL